MNIQEIISNLQCNLDLIQFDPFTGETIDKSCMNKLNRDLCTALEEAIKELQKNSWISVNDRLPGKDTSELLFIADGKVYYGSFGYSKFYAIDNSGICGFTTYEVSHWMPLPEPSEMKGE